MAAIPNDALVRLLAGILPLTTNQSGPEQQRSCQHHGLADS